MLAAQRQPGIPSSPEDAASRRPWPWLAVALYALTAAYVALFALLDSIPLLDYPVHVARSYVMSDLVFNQGRVWGRVFEFQFSPVPYVLPDLVLAALCQLFDPSVAARLSLIAVFVATLASTSYLLRVFGSATEGRRAAVLLSAVLATDYTFLNGFLAFKLGIAFTMLAVAVWHRYSQTNQQRYLLWTTVVLALAYLTHLAAFVFAAAAIGALAVLRALRGTMGIKSLLMSSLSFVPVVAMRLSTTAAELNGPAGWGTPARRAVRVAYGAIRYNVAFDVVLHSAMLAVVIVAARTLGLKGKRAEMLALCGLFFAMYFAMPISKGSGYDIDVRALAPLWVAILGWGFLEWDGRRGRRFLGTMVPLLVLANLLYIGVPLLSANATIRDYRGVLRSIPPGARVFPIATRPSEGRVDHFWHIDAFVITDANAITPYLFSGTTGHPQSYFRYREKLAAPWAQWYPRHQRGPDWPQVCRTYQYLVALRPLDVSRIPVPLVLTASSSSAVLFRMTCPQ